MFIEKTEHIDFGDMRAVRIVWHHPLSAFASPVKHGGGNSFWPLVTDWMPAEVAKELAREIQKALRTKPKKTPKPKAAV